jgi:hypothetical protein
MTALVQKIMDTTSHEMRKDRKREPDGGGRTRLKERGRQNTLNFRSRRN